MVHETLGLRRMRNAEVFYAHARGTMTRAWRIKMPQIVQYEIVKTKTKQRRVHVEGKATLSRDGVLSALNSDNKSPSCRFPARAIDLVVRGEQKQGGSAV